MRTADRSLPDDNGDRDFRTETLRKIATLLCTASTVLIPLVYASSSNPLDFWTTVLFAVISWTSLILIRLGHARYMADFIVFSILFVACIGVYSVGSVRGTANFLFLGGVAAAGIFLGLRALVASVLFSLVALGGFTFAEMQGLLPIRSLDVGPKVWLTQGATIVVIAVMVHYSRVRARMALKRQLDELARRKETELELSRSMERFARIFRASPNPMVAQSGRTGLILDVNPAFERCFGYPRDQVLGQGDAFLWADSDLRHMHQQTLLDQRRSDIQIARFLRCDGSGIDTLLSSEMGEDPDDPLVITSAVDISVQVEAERRLRASEDRFAKAFHFSPLDMKITRMSDGSLVEVGRADQRPNQRNSGKPRDRVPQEWARPEERAAFTERLRGEGHLHGYEAHMMREDGSLIEARLWAELIDIDGEACILSCSLNVSEEKRRDALLKDIAAGLASQTGEAFFVALTHHMARTLDADMVTVSELDGETLRTLAVSRDGQPAPNFEYPLAGTPCGTAMGQTGLCAYAQDIQSQFPDCPPLSQGRFLAFAGQSLRAADGSPAGMLTALWRRPHEMDAESQALMEIFSSRTNAELARLRQEREVRRLNASLELRVKQRTAELEQVNAELDSFAYSVSHDLKSPLRSIDGFTQILQERIQDKIDPEESALMGRVLAATQRMSNLIADMLALARISQTSMDITQVNLSDMAQSIADLEPLNTLERKVEWRIEPGLVCHCDTSLVRIALENLLNNALKYTRDQASPVIEFGQVETSGAPGHWYFIRDNGAGFDMAHSDKLFKPFQRLHMPSAFEGAGIGLATVRRVIERHGGQVRAEAQVGQGATVYFSFGSSSL